MHSEFNRNELIELAVDYRNTLEYEIISDNQSEMNQKVLGVVLHQVWKTI